MGVFKNFRRGFFMGNSEFEKMFGVKSKCYEQCSAVMTHISSICNQKNNVINFNRKGPGFVGSA